MPSGNRLGMRPSRTAEANVRRIQRASRCRPVVRVKPFQADHGVAAPIGEPVVAGDHGANLVALGVRPRRIRHAADRRNQELVGGQHQLGAEAVASFAERPANASCGGAGQLGFERRIGSQRAE